MKDPNFIKFMLLYKSKVLRNNCTTIPTTRDSTERLQLLSGSKFIIYPFLPELRINFPSIAFFNELKTSLNKKSTCPIGQVPSNIDFSEFYFHWYRTSGQVLMSSL